MAELEKLKAADLAPKNLNNCLQMYLNSLNMLFADAGNMGKQSSHADAD